MPVVEATDVIGAITELATPVGILTDSGTIAFTDVDLTDVHTISAIADTTAGGAIGGFTASVTIDTTGTGLGGEITWDYQVAASDIEFLAVNQTRDETFTITLSDGNGGTVDRTVTVTLTGTNDAPTITAAGTTATGLVTETVDAAPAADADPASATGTIAFTDVDLTDVNTAAITSSDVTSSDVTLSATQISNLLDNMGIALTDNADGTGSVAWTYTALNSEIDSLGVNDQITLTYAITVSDPSGETATQNVVITIQGTNDAPVVSAVTGTADEDGAAVFGNFVVADVDVNDDHFFNLTSFPNEGTVTNLNNGIFTFNPGTDFQDLGEGETRAVTFT